MMCALHHLTVGTCTRTVDFRFYLALATSAPVQFPNPINFTRRGVVLKTNPLQLSVEANHLKDLFNLLAHRCTYLVIFYRKQCEGDSSR